MSFVKYIVGQGDTLQQIAISQLGDVTRVDDIVTLNALRYPYVSDDPKDQYAHAKGQLQLQGRANAGSSQITFGNISSLVVLPIDTIYFEEWTSGLHEALIIKSATLNADGTVTVTFQSNLVNSYSVAAVATIFPNQENVTTKVATTGTAIYLPVGASSFTVNPNQATDIYGTDIAIDSSGMILKNGNDIATVSGIDNVAQAVQMRWMTPYGGHPMEPEYGNRMFDILGEENQPYYWDLAKTFGQQCALSDPRVESVGDLLVTPQNDDTFIQAEITPTNAVSGFTTGTILGGE